MNKVLFILTLPIMVAAIYCNANKGVSTGTWQYLNPSGIYIPYTQLETAINNIDIPGFDRASSGAHGWNLENGEGTTAGIFYYKKGSSQTQQQQFMFYVFDSGKKVKPQSNYAGEKPFEILKSTGDSIFAQYTGKDGKYQFLILVKNRLLLQFVAYQASPDELRKVCMDCNLSEFEKLLK